MPDLIEWLTLTLFMFSLATENIIAFLLLISLSIATGITGHYFGAWR